MLRSTQPHSRVRRRKRWSRSHLSPDDGTAFLFDSRDSPSRSDVELAEKLAEEFVASATSADEVRTETSDELTDQFRGPRSIHDDDVTRSDEYEAWRVFWLYLPFL